MANLGFSSTPTAALIFKVMGTGKDWSHQERLDCYLASASGELPDNIAQAQFMFLLNKLGISQVDNVSIPYTVKDAKDGKGKAYIDIFNATGKAVSTLSDTDKRKAIAKELFKSIDPEISYKMLDGVPSGTELDELYNKQCAKTNKSELPFVMYRIRIGTYTIFRVTNEEITPASLGTQAVNYLATAKKIS